jgi:tetratricopeptide (TPR) repeat protein
MNRFLILLTLLLIPAAATPAFASDPEVERIVESMDRRMDAGRLDEVLEEAKARVAKADTAVNRYLLGRAYGLTQEYEKAREQFEIAFERDLGSPYAYHGKGAYHLVKGEFEAAERNLQRALQCTWRGRTASGPSGSS